MVVISGYVSSIFIQGQGDVPQNCPQSNDVPADTLTCDKLNGTYILESSLEAPGCVWTATLSNACGISTLTTQPELTATLLKTPPLGSGGTGQPTAPVGSVYLRVTFNNMTVTSNLSHLCRSFGATSFMKLLTLPVNCQGLTSIALPYDQSSDVADCPTWCANAARNATATVTALL